MHVTLRNHTGINVDAIVLAACRDRMRVVVPNSADTIELRRKNKQWMTESGDPVEFEFMMADEQLDMAVLCHHVRHSHGEAA